MLVSKIGNIRRSKGLQQNYVAKQIKVSKQSLSDWERGEVYPKANHLFDLADFFEVKVDDLYERIKE
ncbi:helix-turn-helix domain-containing protein [Radiobacillus sp. PE A8.2]|uniref:helix-turn-helix domain-containing protein n=1 Tax=Radiobacillus sp. PE A8.2 TaxID=3380349 RepID=UPI003890FF95